MELNSGHVIFNEIVSEKLGYEQMSASGFQYYPGECHKIAAHLKRICNDNNIVNRAVCHLIHYAHYPVLIKDKKAMLNYDLRHYEKLTTSIELLLGFSHSLVGSDVYGDIHDLQTKNTYPAVFDEPIEQFPVEENFAQSYERLKAIRTSLIVIHEALQSAMVGVVEVCDLIDPHASKNAFKEYITSVENIAASKWEAVGGEINYARKYREYFQAVTDPIYHRAPSTLSKENASDSAFRNHVARWKNQKNRLRFS